MKRSLWSLISAVAAVLLLIYEYLPHQATFHLILNSEQSVSAFIMEWRPVSFVALLALCTAFLCLGYLCRATGFSIAAGVLLCIIWLLAPALKDVIAVLVLMILAFVGVSMQNKLDQKRSLRRERTLEE